MCVKYVCSLTSTKFIIFHWLIILKFENIPNKTKPGLRFYFVGFIQGSQAPESVGYRPKHSLVIHWTSFKRSRTSDLWQTDHKINNGHLHDTTNLHTKSVGRMPKHSLVIGRTKSGLQTDWLTYRPIDMCKAIYPHFFKGSIIISL